jgi:hypothetical protein
MASGPDAWQTTADSPAAVSAFLTTHSPWHRRVFSQPVNDFGHTDMHVSARHIDSIQSSRSVIFDACCFETRTGHETAAISIRRVSGEPRLLHNANQNLGRCS